jgi:hypothetical protein
LWWLARRPLFRRRVWLSALLMLAAAASLALSISMVRIKPAATFYLLPTRMWELLLGVTAAFLPIPRQTLFAGRLVREALSITGLTLILVPVYMYGAGTVFPGGAAIPPCLGAALLIWAEARHEGGASTLTGRVLAWRPFVFIGLISYSWYLWHWPPLAYNRYLALGPETPAHKWSMLLMGLGLAVLSWRFVETPFRTRRICAGNKAMLASGVGGLAVVLVIGWLYHASQGAPSRLSAEALRIANAVGDREFIEEHTAEEVIAGDLTRLGKEDSHLPTSVFVWGDSHAMALMPAVDQFLRERGLAGAGATHSLTAPVLGWYAVMPHGLNELSASFNDAVFKHIETNKIPVVLLHSLWRVYTSAEQRNVITFEDALVDTVSRLRAAGTAVYLVLDVPAHGFFVPRILARSQMIQKDLAPWQSAPCESDRRDGISEETISAIVRLGAIVLDPKPELLDPETGRYRIQKDEVVLYRDASHLTAAGARLMLKPFLDSALGVLLPKAAQE